MKTGADMGRGGFPRCNLRPWSVLQDEKCVSLSEGKDLSPAYVCTVVQCSIYDAAMQRNMTLQGGKDGFRETRI